MVEIESQIRGYFKGLGFEEKRHLYTLNNKLLRNVSGIVSTFSVPFDVKTRSIAYAKKHNRTPEDVVKEWKKINTDSIIKGKNTHTLIELGGELPPHIQKFFDEEVWIRYEIVAKELKMYHKVFGYAGTADLILRDKSNGQYIIVDYKTNANLFKNFAGKTLLGIFDDLLDSPFNKYQIQLSLYKMMLEQYVPVSELWIVHFTDTAYEKYKSKDYSDRLIKHFINENRRSNTESTVSL